MEHPRLYVMAGPRQGTQAPLEVSPFTIGREPDNTLSLPEPSISRHHARILERIGLYWLEDLGTTNGTWLKPPQGAEIRLEREKPVLLLEGMQIRLGRETLLRVEGISPSQADATRQTLQRLQSFVASCYQQMSALAPQERRRVEEELRRLEAEIRQASSEEEILQRIALRLTDLSQTVVCEHLPDESGLPELPEGLPDPNSPYRLGSLHNLFLSSLRRIFEEQGGKEGGR